MLNRIVILLTLLTLVREPSIVYAVTLEITNNGSESTSEVQVSSTTEVNVVQTNSVDINNNINTTADTGNNTANQNLGDTSINTGDVNTTVAVTNVANTQITQIDQECCWEESLTISGNGSGSQNQISNTTQATTSFTTINNANITNSVMGIANTGNNQASKNIGNVNINTGNIIAKQLILNGPVNSNIVIASIPQTASFKAAINSNGTESVNKISSVNNFVSQNNMINNANIINNSNWFLNTGNNIASRNNGDVEISTGNIFADLVIKNVGINSNILQLTFACCPDDPDKPDDPDDPGDPDDPSDPGDGNGNGDAGGGSSNGSSSSSSSSGPAILGLSYTAS